MKPTKMLGLAVMVVLIATAFIGPSSAMGGTTALCNKDETPCPTKQIISHVHESTLSGAKATLLTPVFDVECDTLFLGDTLSGTSAPLVIHGEFTYSNCNNNCQANEENGPAEIVVLRTSHETAVVAGEGLVHLVCGFFINCYYDGVGLVGTGRGPLLSSETNGEVALSDQGVNIEKDVLCPRIGELDIVTTPLSATYVVSKGAMDCVARVGGLYSTDGGTSCSNNVGLGNGSFELVN